ncbi:MAG: hypothetical protein FJY83_00700 [Candidatus Aminicenantes bacterium]|nr:hypothetical protein [Candidatus Aminicenantes bacterium]
MGFESVVGQERVKNILRSALRRGRVPNSLLFVGPEGVGKRTTAFILARALNCLRGGDDPCEECGPCRAVLAGLEDGSKGFPDVKEIKAGGKEMLPSEEDDKEKTGNHILIRQARYVKHHAYRRPMVGRKKVFIVNEAERMKDEAWDTLLKVLEEPPPLTHLMILTAYRERIPLTIVSRCASISFGLIPREKIEAYLLKSGRTPEEARNLAFLSCGSLAAALGADLREKVGSREKAWKILLGLLRREGGHEFLEEYGSLKRGRGTDEELTRLWQAMTALLRDLLLVRESGEEGLLINRDFKEELQAEAGRFSSEELRSALESVDRSLIGLKNSQNISLLVSAFCSDIIDR